MMYLDDNICERLMRHLKNFNELWKEHRCVSIDAAKEKLKMELQQQLNVEVKMGYLHASINNMLDNLEDCLSNNLSEQEQTIVLFFWLREIDIAIHKDESGAGRSRIFGNELSIKGSGFWKQSRYSQDSDRSPFTSMSLFELPKESQIVDIGELIFDSNLDDPLENMDELKIGLFPLSASYKVKFKLTRVLDTQARYIGFQTDTVNYPNYKSELKTIAQKIRDEGIHIACFPEMLICDEGFAFLCDELKDSNFLLLIAGSYHRVINGEGEIKNVMPVRLIINKKPIDDYYYSKMESYKMPVGRLMTGNTEEERRNSLGVIFSNADKYPELQHTINSTQAHTPGDTIVSNFKEHIDLGHGVLVLKFGRLGNMGFLICKDYHFTFNNDLLQVYSKLADHIFVASLNISDAAGFEANSQSMVVQHRVAAYYVNATSFDRDLKSPSFSFIPAKNSSDHRKDTPGEKNGRREDVHLVVSRQVTRKAGKETDPEVAKVPDWKVDYVRIDHSVLRAREDSQFTSFIQCKILKQEPWQIVKIRLSAMDMMLKY